MGNISRVFVIVFASSLASYGQWLTYQHDPNRTGRSDASFDPRGLRYAWSSPTGFARPIVTADTVFASRTLTAVPAQNEYAAFDLQTGKQQWSVQVQWSSTGPAVLNGLFVVLDGGQHLRVFDSATGALLTDTPLSGVFGQGMTSPILLPGAIQGHIDCFLSGNGFVRKFDISPNSTTQVWTAVVGGGGPLTLGGSSIFDTQPGAYFAVDRATGIVNKFYSGPITGGSFSAPIFDPARSRFYAEDTYATDSDALTACNYSDNSHIAFLWEIKNGPRQFSSAALGSGGELHFVDVTGYLREYTPEGVLSRTSTKVFRQGVTPVIQNGYLWIADVTSTYALDLLTLEPVVTLPTATPYADADTFAGIIFDQGFYRRQGRQSQQWGI